MHITKGNDRSDGDHLAASSVRVQPKLIIGETNDSFEQEADAVADQVMHTNPDISMTSSGHKGIQRKCDACQEEDEKVQRKPLGTFIQRKEISTSIQASDAVSKKINASRDGGNAIDSTTLSFMQSRFGADFSNVKIQKGSEAIQMNRDLNARAFTVGNDIYFNEGQYSPDTNDGKKLLAHELTHTIQQGESNVIQRQPNPAPPPAPVQNSGLSDLMLEQIAKRLRDAMSGLGTDEEAIYSSFSGRTQAEVDAIEQIYNEHYDRSLIADLQDELNEDELKHLAIFSPTAVEGKSNGFAMMVAYQLRDAMEGWGTDESSIMSALTGRTVEERAAIQGAYFTLTRRDLRDDLYDELSGADLITAIRLLDQGILSTEDEVYLAIAGAGTDEEGLMNALGRVKGDRAKIKALIEAYKAKGYGDMLHEVRDDLSGEELDDAIQSMHGETTSGTCNSAQRKVALLAISEAASMAQKAIGRLQHDISEGRLSDGVESALKNNFNPGNSPGAVDVALARRVLPPFVNAYTDMLMTSDVDCGDTGLCIGKQNCLTGTISPMWTGIGRLSTVQICSSFFECSSDKVTTMLHEFIHHTGVDDQFYHFQPGFSTLIPIGDGSGTDSLNNADSFAYFAKDIS